jgi:hypothetical protein
MRKLADHLLYVDEAPFGEERLLLH